MADFLERLLDLDAETLLLCIAVIGLAGGSAAYDWRAGLIVLGGMALTILVYRRALAARAEKRDGF